MQKTSSKQALTGIKLLFAAGSLVFTLILWNLFSNKAIDDALKQNQDAAASAGGVNNNLAQQMPLPTLIPLQFDLPAGNPALQPASETVPTESSLRKVTAPTNIAPQKPVIREVTINQSGGSGGGGGGGGGGASAPAATTGSSR